VRKAGKKQRDIRFRSMKNGRVMLVHTQEELSYANQLEADERVAAYEYGRELDPSKLAMVKKVDIRTEYLKWRWESDFIITFRDGTTGVREIETYKKLTMLPNIERLELSRRYWKYAGVSDWKAVIVGGGLCS